MDNIIDGSNLIKQHYLVSSTFLPSICTQWYYAKCTNTKNINSATLKVNIFASKRL